MLNSILVPIDSSIHSRAGLDHALDLGRAYRARLTGLHVLDIRYLEMPPYLDYSYTFEAVPPTLVPIDVMEKFRIRSERLLNDFREAVERAGLPVDTRTEEGVPGQVIVDIGGAHDLIVMGKKGEHAKWGRDPVGSTAENVARHSPTPVLLVEGRSRPVRKALVLFDGSHPAIRALRLAADLARRASVDLRILTVDDDPERGKATQEEARSYLEPLNLRAIFDVVPGRTAKVTVAAVEDYPADMLVLGVRGHSALHDLILGSTAQQLMRSVELPLLLVP